MKTKQTHEDMLQSHQNEQAALSIELYRINARRKQLNTRLNELEAILYAMNAVKELDKS